MRASILILMMLIMSCDSKQIMIDIQGHRGCRGLLPENSLPAFKHAIELGVHTLEMDIVISKDKKVVVSHEPFMSRRTCLDGLKREIPSEMDRRYNLYQMTYEEIKRFDCGLKKHPDYPNQKKIETYKPLLEDVFNLSDELNSKIKFNIEIKARPAYDNEFTPEPKEYVSLVLKVIKDYYVFNRSVLQSFDLRILEEVKNQAPKMKVALLVDEDEEINLKLPMLSFKPEIISPHYRFLKNDTINKYQEKGFKMIPWTVNEIEDLQKMIDFKVDGIITDYPDRLIQLLN